MRRVSDYCIRKGLEEINEEDYLATLEKVISKKLEELRGEDHFTAQQKTAQYAMRKGYESELIWRVIKS